RVGRERIQDGRVEARYRLRCVAKGARVSARPRDGRGEPARVEEDEGEQGAALLLRFTEAQGVFRQGRAALDAAGFGRLCTRRRDRSLRKGRGPERLGASRTLHRRASSSHQGAWDADLLTRIRSPSPAL